MLGDDRAIATTTFGYRDAQGIIKYVSGTINGRIVTPRGTEETAGFNRIFQPDNQGKTFAEMTIKDKNAVSMRGIAARTLAEMIANGV